MNIWKIVNEVTAWGVSEEQENYLQKKILLTNEICLLATVAIAIFILTAAVFDQFYLVYNYLTLLLIVIITLAANKAGRVHFSRFFISYIPVLALLVPYNFRNEAVGVNYLGLSFSIIAFNLVPLLIYNVPKEKMRFATAITYNLIFLLFYDRLLLLFEGKNSIPDFIDENYVFLKTKEIQLWVFIVIAIMFIKRMNRRFEKKLEILNLELKESNKEIMAQNEEIAATNEEISASNEELLMQQEQIGEQRNHIESQNTELKQYQNKLLDYIYELSKTNSKLAKQQAENKSILSALRLNFIMLEFDLDARVTWVTAKTCEYLGIGKSKIIGRKGSEFLELIPDGHRMTPTFELLWDKVLLGESINADFELIMPGKELCISATFAPIMDENGESIKILAIAEDISSIIHQQKIIENKNHLLEVQQKEIKERNEELHQQKEEIEAINETLEQRVKERTQVLEQKNRQLSEYAFINAHLLRAPVSSILGLINLMGHEKLNAKELELYKYLKDSANQLDKIVFKINRAIELNKEFDREFLRD